MEVPRETRAVREHEDGQWPLEVVAVLAEPPDTWLPVGRDTREPQLELLPSEKEAHHLRLQELLERRRRPCS